MTTEIDVKEVEQIVKDTKDYFEQMDKKYGNYLLENDRVKFIWGIINWDHLPIIEDTNLYSMNDIDILYDKQEEKYYLDMKVAYFPTSVKKEYEYLQGLLKAFTKYMDDNNLDKNYQVRLFSLELLNLFEANSIEKLYANFKLFVNGFGCQIKEEEHED